MMWVICIFLAVLGLFLSEVSGAAIQKQKTLAKTFQSAAMVFRTTSYLLVFAAIWVRP